MIINKLQLESNVRVECVIFQEKLFLVMFFMNHSHVCSSHYSCRHYIPVHSSYASVNIDVLIDA